MTLKKILIAGVVIVALVGAYIWFFQFNKPHKDIEEAKADYTLEIEEIVNEFEVQFDSSITKYNGKVVEISGTMDRIEPNDSISSIVFKVGDNYEVYCEVYPKYNAEALKMVPNTKTTIKGFFSGAEKPDTDFDIAGVLRLKKCSFAQPK